MILSENRFALFRIMRQISSNATHLRNGAVAIAAAAGHPFNTP
jgi:hypothetical protein